MPLAKHSAHPMNELLLHLLSKDEENRQGKLHKLKLEKRMSPPLDTKIHFLIAVPDSQPEESTPLQGFAPSLCLNSFLIRTVSGLPSDIFDLTPEGRRTLLARRLCGVDPINWIPQSPGAIQSIPLPAMLPFTVVMLGKGQEAKEYSAWVNSSDVPPTIVAENGADLTYADLTIEGLQKRFLEVCESIPSVVEAELVRTAKSAIKTWAPIADRSLGYTVAGHGSVTPNLMALTTCGYRELVRGPFDKINEGIKPYVEQITATARSVLQERETGPTLPKWTAYFVACPLSIFSRLRWHPKRRA